MITATIKGIPERCLWGALLVATVYQSYRYPFQINSAGTSPTYSDTPMVLQLGKFLFVLAISSVSFRYIFDRALTMSRWAVAISAIGLSAFCLAKAAGGEMDDKVHYLDVAFWPVATLIIVLASRPVSVASLDKYFKFVYLLAVASTLLEVTLFLTIGRLPALAYIGTLSIRFGGFLDDPNGFAAIIYFLAGWAFYRFSGRTRFYVLITLMVCLLLTQSFTALGFLVLLGVGFIGMGVIKARRLPLIFLCATLLIAVILVLWPHLADLASAVVGDRAASVDQHISQVTNTQAASRVWWLFGDDTYQPYESWWYSAVVNFGIPWMLVNLIFAGTLFLSVYRAFRRALDTRSKAVLSGILLFSAYFCVGAGNLPFFVIFPINFMFFFFGYLVLFRKLDSFEASESKRLTLSGRLR